MAIPSSEVTAETLQDACCYKLCPPIKELEDNIFLAAVYAYLVSTGLEPIPNATMDEIRSANDEAWCELWQTTLCSIPPDVLKALIIWQIRNGPI